MKESLGLLVTRTTFEDRQVSAEDDDPGMRATETLSPLKTEEGPR